MAERKSIKVALVNPPRPAGARLHQQFPIKGLAYLAALLLKDGFNVKVIDCLGLNMDQDGLRREIDSFEPDIVGITSQAINFSSALQAARVIKESYPRALIVLGGIHATFMDIDTLSKFAYVDVVVRREGEQTMLELARYVARGKNLHRVAGITFRKNCGITRTADRPFIQNLDELPFPAYQFFPMEEYRFFGRKLLPVNTSRGCPFRCSFCLEPKMFGNRIRARSPKNVVDELEWLRDVHGADAFFFHDAVFTYDKKRVFEICEEMINRKIGLPWDCETRVDQVSKEVLVKMREANCQLVSFSVESGSQKILNAMKKGTTVEQNERAIMLAKEVGLSVAMYVMVGHPGETMSTLKQSLDFIRRTEPDDVYICFAMPYPGTEVYDFLKEMGWKLSTDWHLYDNVTPVFENPFLPAEKMMEIRKTFYDHFYSRSYIFRQWLKGGSYNRCMSRAALSYYLWQIKLPKWVVSNSKKLTLRQ